MSQLFQTILIVVQVIAALVVIGLVLLQKGKGADLGASFGGGSAGSLFGAAGSANFFSRMTKWAAIVFIASTLGLAYVQSDSFSKGKGLLAHSESSSVLDQEPVETSTVPMLPPETPVSAQNSTVPMQEDQQTTAPVQQEEPVTTPSQK